VALPVAGEISIGMLHFEVNSGDGTTTLTSETATSSDAGADLAAIANDFADNATTAGVTPRSDLAAAPYGMDEFYQYSYNSCVLVGTEILMFDNSIKLVEDLIIDDEVSSVQIPGMTKQNYRKFSTANLDLFRGEPGRVKLLAFDFVTKHIRINDKYNATHMHPMFVWKDSISRFEWWQSGDVEVGDTLVNSKLELEEVEKIEKMDGDFEIVTLGLRDYHTYFANGYLCHQ
tara:strand:- start:3816 stop:4508 length:693 start_codon:yes stop_codon:yes gene_type:complete